MLILLSQLLGPGGLMAGYSLPSTPPRPCLSYSWQPLLLLPPPPLPPPPPQVGGKTKAHMVGPIFSCYHGGGYTDLAVRLRV